MHFVLNRCPPPWICCVSRRGVCQLLRAHVHQGCMQNSWVECHLNLKFGRMPSPFSSSYPPLLRCYAFPCLALKMAFVSLVFSPSFPPCNSLFLFVFFLPLLSSSLQARHVHCVYVCGAVEERASTLNPLPPTLSPLPSPSPTPSPSRVCAPPTRAPSTGTGSERVGAPRATP